MPTGTASCSVGAANKEVIKAKTSTKNFFTFILLNSSHQSDKIISKEEDGDDLRFCNKNTDFGCIL